jgi:hypothetical protein
MRMWARRLRRSIGTIALAVTAALFCSGCPALMVPGLAYQGYKYEHDKNKPAASASSTPNAKSTATAQKKIPDNEIE